MRAYLLIAALVLLFGCIVPSPEQNVTNESVPTTITPGNGVSTPPVTEPENVTGPEPAEPRQLLPTETLDLGDIALVNYTLWVNGNVLDTTNATLANESGIYNPYRTYQPFSYMVQFHQGVIDGFIINTIGMRINETVVFHVDPDRGYGPYDPSKVVTVPRYYNKSFYEEIPRSYLEDQGINISNGTAFGTAYGDVFITDFNEENVTLFYILFPGHSFVLNGVPQVINSTDTDAFIATIEYMLQENQTYVLPNPKTGAATNYKVIGKTDQNITLDPNHPLANETLTFQVTLIDAVRPS